jgi:prepilin-type N-terminal cleavage/methylation domain-containing protein
MRRVLHRKSTEAPRLARLSLLRRSDAGFTMIELLVSALLVAIIAAGLAEALIAGTDFSADQRLRTQADAVAQQDQERLRGLSDEQLAALSQTRTLMLDNTSFTVTSSAAFLDATGGSSCQTKVAAYFRLVSTVTWSVTPTTPAHSITESTIMTRPAAGSLLVQVVDENGAWLPGVTITTTGQTTGASQWAVTDASGCVVFSGLPGLPVQSYGIAAAAAGKVDWDGNDSPPNVTAAVNGTGVATPNLNPLIMGRAGSITASFATTAYNGVQVITGVPGYYLTYYGSLGNHMSSTPTATASPMPSATISSLPSIPSKQSQSLFPFASLPGPSYANNYQVWAGQCDQEQPAQPPLIGSPSVQTNYATVTPGAVAVPATVVEPALDAAISYNGTPVTPTDVKITFTSTPGSGTACNDTWYPVASVHTDSVGGVTYNTYPAPFASTSAAGTPTASLQGQTGTVSLCADYLTAPSTYRHESSPATTNTNFTGPSAYFKMDLGTDGKAAAKQC